ncbi:MucBP domain-containing protein, partial [Lactococcus taiwanensis]|uniref:MucBP domain-containing protein n=1 Tax=Lactococcus taiwanensis TaxID=1151742 RepID=UPI001F3A5BD4
MSHTKKFKIMSTSAVALQLISTGMAPVVAATQVSPQRTNQTAEAQAANDYTASLVTNANIVSTGSVLDLQLFLKNNDDDKISAGTVFTINISSEAIDYNAIDFSDATITNFFDYSTDEAAGQIKLTLKQDVVGNGTEVNPIIHIPVTGKAGENYTISVTASDGTSVPVTNDTITIKDNENNAVYGDINTYWGLHEGLNGNFIGQAAGLEKTGIFSRSKNQIDIFGEFNTSYEHWDHFINNTDRWVTLKFDYDPRETLDTNSIQLYKKSNYDLVPYKLTEPMAGEHVAWVNIDEANHSFTVQLKDNWIVGGASSQEVLVVGYSATVTDATLTYDNTMTLEKEDNSVVQNFPLHSIFSEDGASNVFPTVQSKDLRYPLGQLSAENAEDILKRDSNASATDTIDGVIDPSEITVDTSKVDFTKPGNYEVKYKVKNSSGNTDGKTYHVEIYAETAEDVTVKYVDESGNSIHDSQTIKGNIGDEYDASTPEYKLTIPGYTLDEKKLPTNATGTLTDKAQIVTYVYSKDAVAAEDVTVK